MHLKAFLRFAVVVVCAASAAPSYAQGRSLASSVVKLDVVSDCPDLLTPWQTEGVDISVGSGVIIEGNRILTNAHVVECAVAIEVKRADGSARFPGEVLFISHDADLALVEVPDARFFEGARPVPLGKMPRLQQEVVVYGFPVGGNTLSITSGIVSRVEVDTYTHSYRDFLSVQIDAAINAGNSGGPVLAGGSLVGIAMQGMAGADNVGYMIPSPVIAHFLKDVRDGRYDGYPRLGIAFQDMESEAQRRGAQMSASQSGALVLRVDYGGPSHGVLRPRDVLLSIDGRPIANDLSVAWEGIGRVGFELAYQSKQIGETIELLILRRGKRLRKKIELTPHSRLVPGRRATEWPRYVHFGGLVFQALTEQLIDDADAGYSDAVTFAEVENLVTPARREIILLGQVLPHRVNRGYQEWGGETIKLVNGVVPRDLRHLAQIIDLAKGPWFRVVTSDGYLITLELEAARRANAEIRLDYGIPDDRYLGSSDDETRRRRGR
jgi:S1-C subfamily serine protease